ncbi:MAG: winged helix-turn-helix domain-containing protein [Armatimonadetes bacterium]|nr:winged helix-turn-helix domain-containing protein [Armatimonadota bacterium]
MSASSVSVPANVLRRLSHEPDLLGVYTLLAGESSEGSSVPLSGDALASLVGCSRATAFRVLRRLEAAGVLRSERRPATTVRHLTAGGEGGAL